MSEEKKDGCCSSEKKGCCCAGKLVLMILVAVLLFGAGYLAGKHCKMGMGGEQMCPFKGAPAQQK